MTKINPYHSIVSGQPQAPASAGVAAGVRAPTNTRLASKADEAIYDETGSYNPKAFGGRDAIRDAVPQLSKNRLFDKQGQLNADNKRDALQQIAHLLQSVAGTDASKRAFGKQAMAGDDRRKVLAQAVQTDEGFKVLGQELLLPIKDIVDYEGWGRKILRVRQLAQGELFRISKDVRSAAMMIGQDGQALETRLYGKYIQPSEFKIASFTTVDIEDIMQMNYDVLDRAQDTARQEIELEEDKRVYALLDNAATAVNTNTTFATLGIGAFEDVKYQVERHRLVVEKFLINRAELSDIIKTMSTQVDPVTERELILAGFVGSVLNCMIVTAAGTGVEEVIPAGTFFGVVGPEYLGEFGIRVELFSEPYNKFGFRETVKGWAFCEMIGMALVNARGVARGRK